MPGGCISSVLLKEYNLLVQYEIGDIMRMRFETMRRRKKMRKKSQWKNVVGKNAKKMEKTRTCRAYIHD